MSLLSTNCRQRGSFVFTAGVNTPSAEKIVTAIKSDREDRINKHERRFCHLIDRA